MKFVFCILFLSSLAVAKPYKRVFGFYIGIDEGEKESVLTEPTERNMKGFEEMTALQNNEDVAIVVQIDEPNEDPNYRYQVKYKERIIIPEKNIQKYDPDFKYGEKDSGNPLTLKKYLMWLVQAYPAERYMLTLSGHSWGKLGIIEDFFVDGKILKKATMIRNYELRRILEEVSYWTQKKLKIKPKFDVLMADACNWAQLESTLEVVDHFDYFLGTSLESPYFGVSFYKVLNPYIESLSQNSFKNEAQLNLHTEENLLKPLVKNYLYEHQPGSDLAKAEKQIDVIQSVAIRLKVLKSFHHSFEEMVRNIPKNISKTYIPSYIKSIRDADENLDLIMLARVYQVLFKTEFEKTGKVEWKIASDKALKFIEASNYRAPNPTLWPTPIKDANAIGAWVKVEIDPYAEKDIAVCNALKSFVAVNKPFYSPLPWFFDIEESTEVFIHQKFCDALVTKEKHIISGKPITQLYGLKVVWPNKNIPAYYIEENKKKYICFWIAKTKTESTLNKKFIFRLPGTRQIEIHYISENAIEYAESRFQQKKLRTKAIESANLETVYFVDDNRALGSPNKKPSLYVAAGHSNGTLTEGLSVFVGNKMDNKNVHHQGYLPAEIIEASPYKLSIEHYDEFLNELQSETEVTPRILNKYSPYIKTLALGQKISHYKRAGFDFYRLHKISSTWANFLEGQH